MKNKLEQKLDAKFEGMGVCPHIYHFRRYVQSFSAITLAEIQFEPWELLEAVVERATRDANNEHENKATLLLAELQRERIYGIAICDKRDQFNRQRGRIIAKGRLLKHLKEIAK